MERTTDHTVAAASQNPDSPAKDFSFGTTSEWTGWNAETMRIHSRARIIQSQQRSRQLRRDRDALIDLAAEGDRLMATAMKAQRPSSLRHLQSVSRFSSLDDLPSVELDATPQEVDLRDRSVLLDLRRSHEIVARQRIAILRDTQPRSATADRRWG